jgi:hypothetical protein
MKTERKYFYIRGVGRNTALGYIYARLHPSYVAFNACKVGKTKNLTLRDRQYATNEIVRGRFEVVFVVPLGSMEFIEKFLMQDFDELRVKVDGGVEFYSRSIIPLIRLFLKKYRVPFRQLRKENINALLDRPIPTAKVPHLKAKAKKNIDVLKSKAEETFTDLK